MLVDRRGFHAMNLVISAFLIFALRLSQGQIFNISTLKYVTVISRHGSRAAISTYPTDPYPPNNTKYWPEGPGQLTSLGKRQAYNIGVNLRKRYVDYLSPDKPLTETLITSNLMVRDLASAQLVGAGMYPPTGHQIWNENLLWQPVPVWPDPFDVVDVTDRGLCPRFEYLKKKAYEKSYKEIYLPNKPFFDLINNLTGANFSSLRKIKGIHDSLAIHELHGLELAPWAKSKDLRAKLADLARSQLVVKATSHRDMIRLTAGPVLKNIVTQLENKSKPKILVQLSHDNTIFCVAFALGLEDFPLPEMAAHLIFELHTVPREGDIVQLLYVKNSTTTTPALVDMPACRHPCSLGKFIDVTRQISPDSWEAECWMNSSSSVPQVAATSLMMLLYYAAIAVNSLYE